MMKNKRNISMKEFDNLDDLSEDVNIILDDRPRKFDLETGKFVSPDEEKYNDLPNIEY